MPSYSVLGSLPAESLPGTFGLTGLRLAEKTNRTSAPARHSAKPPSSHRQTPSSVASETATATTTTPDPMNEAAGGNPTSKSPTPTRPPFGRNNSAEKLNGVNGSSPQRRGSWFSSISAKFSSPTSG